MNNQLSEWKEESLKLRQKFLINDDEVSALLDRLNDRLLTLIHRVEELERANTRK